MKVSLSIDFGTTNTLIASIGADGKVTVFHLGRSGLQCPSTVYMQADGSLFFGDDAEDMAQIDPAGYRRAFKMKLGSPAPMLGRYTAADITAKFLSHLLEQVRQDASMRGATIGSVVLTCPVNFSPAQRESLRRAAVAAGLSKVELVDEPAAAGLAFCRSTGTQAFKHNALVVDWGGGTLDMALVTRGADGRVTVNSAYSYGRNDMGGEVFDDCLCEHMLSKVTLPQVAWPNLNRRVRALKHRLSTHESGIFNIVSEGRMVSEPIKRSTFEQLIAPNLRLVGAAVKRLLECVPADKKPEMLVLVGGSALVPCIRRELEQASGLPTHTWNEAHVAIVKGGAYWGIPAEEKKTPEPQRTLRRTDSAEQSTLIISVLGRYGTLLIPIGTEGGLSGQIDVVHQRSIHADCVGGTYEVRPLMKKEHIDIAAVALKDLVSTVADVDNEIGELFLMEEPIDTSTLKSAIRRACSANLFIPVKADFIWKLNYLKSQKIIP